jgi:hypothetical protein
MDKRIAHEIKSIIKTYSQNDKIIFKNRPLAVDLSNFSTIHPNTDSSENDLLGKENNKTITYIDGGEAQIISVGNFCLSFIRIAAVKFCGVKKLDITKNEFFLLTSAKTNEGKLYYHSKIFPAVGEPLISELQLVIDSNDSTIRNGKERAQVSKVSNMARRFCELNLAKKLAKENYSDYFFLDGTLEPTFLGEEELVNTLPNNVCALSKTSSLFTQLGNNPSILLSKIGPNGCFSYFLTDKTYFVKLHDSAKHVFRFETISDVDEILPLLLQNSIDPLFLGYPYGLIFADRIARVSNNEKSALSMKFLLNKENKEIADYLSTNNAHDILDRIG